MPAYEKRAQIVRRYPCRLKLHVCLKMQGNTRRGCCGPPDHISILDQAICTKVESNELRPRSSHETFQDWGWDGCTLATAPKQHQ